MVKSIDTSNLSYSVSPNYLKLLSFLIEPLLDSPDSLKIDCEEIPSTKRVWIRLAVDEGDKGRIYGRGGRIFSPYKMFWRSQLNRWNKPFIWKYTKSPKIIVDVPVIIDALSQIANLYAVVLVPKVQAILNSPFALVGKRIRQTQARLTDETR